MGHAWWSRAECPRAGRRTLALRRDAGHGVPHRGCAVACVPAERRVSHTAPAPVCMRTSHPEHGAALAPASFFLRRLAGAGAPAQLSPPASAHLLPCTALPSPTTTTTPAAAAVVWTGPHLRLRSPARLPTMLARAAPHRLLALRPLPLLPRAPFAGLAAASAPRTLCTSRTRSSAAPHSETPLSANTSASASTSTSTPTHAPVPASAPTPTPTPPPPPPAPKPKKGFFRRTFNVLVWAVVLTAAGVTWKLYDARHPPQQLPHDPSKKTIVVLGSGWASTSFLKHLDTDQFNVVVISPHN